MKKVSTKIFSGILLLSIIFSFICTFFIKKEVNAALSSQYTQYVKSGINAFPESYQKSLAYLKYLHPNWEFKAYYTGISWNELTSSSAENKCLKNTVHKGDLLDPSALCICGQHGDPGYYCASSKMVNFYLDPRNFLGEAMVFQFLDLSNGAGVTRDVVNKATQGTYLNKYVDDIMTAANEAKINPLHIVATIFQEIGRTDTPRAISGTVPGYVGLYNFYNYGATDGNGAVERGLAKAKELGWTSPKFALIDGAKRVLANGYISVGQTTKYFYKFDVVGNEILTELAGKKSFSSNQFYNHQYMSNLRDPSSQAGSLYDIYANSQILDQNLTFTIPVYDGMPAQKSSAPTTLTATPQYGLYSVNTLKKWGITLRATPSASGRSLGNLYKDTVVLHIGNTGNWGKVKIYKVTNYDSSAKKWNYTEQIGYMSNEYIQRINYELPDYRSKVNMGAGSTQSNTQPTTPKSEEANFKIDGDFVRMTPSVNVENIKQKHSDAIIKNADNQAITDNKALVGTGYKITISGKEYVAIKLGDTNGDGSITPADYVKIKNKIMGNNNLNQYTTISADVNGDGSITPADYVKVKNHIMNVTHISI